MLSSLVSSATAAHDAAVTALANHCPSSAASAFAATAKGFSLLSAAAHSLEAAAKSAAATAAASARAPSVPIQGDAASAALASALTTAASATNWALTAARIPLAWATDAATVAAETLAAPSPASAVAVASAKAAAAEAAAAAASAAAAAGEDAGEAALSLLAESAAAAAASAASGAAGSALADPYCSALTRIVAFPPLLLPTSARALTGLSRLPMPAVAAGPELSPAAIAAVVASIVVLFILLSRVLIGLRAAFGLSARSGGKAGAGGRGKSARAPIGPAAAAGFGARPNGQARDVYLTDVATVQSFDPRCAVESDMWFKHIHKYFGMEEEEIEFDKKILERSGIGPVTHLPVSILGTPPDISMRTAREESATVMFDVVRQLLDRTKVKPRDVDIVIVNCSLFNPTPSHAAMIINHFGMRPDTVAYSLAGMGCSASLVAIDLAADVLAMSSRPDPIAIVVSFENLTQNLYFGKDKPMHLANVLFRMGGAGMMLTRTPTAARGGKHPAARWRLNHLVRTHLGSDTTGYECIFQDVDAEGKVGVRLSKEVPRVATRALTHNMTALAPRVLPLRAKLGYAVREVWRRMRSAAFKATGGSSEEARKKFRPTVPNFKAAVDFFCIHAGGRAVIDGIQETLSLTDKDVEPSRSVLYKYGNTSSSSIWYELQYVEKNNRVRRGQKVWQIAFGSGFKCNSAVWERL